MRNADSSPLDTLEMCFRLLCAQPAALSVDGRPHWPCLPPRPVVLDELRGRMPSLDPQVQAAIVTILLQRARSRSPVWQVGFAGLLLPGLRRLARRLANPAAAAEARVLTSLRVGLTTSDPDTDQWILWLANTTWEAQRACETSNGSFEPSGSAWCGPSRHHRQRVRRPARP